MSTLTNKPAPWVMPDWMEPFRESFNNTGSQTVEELIRRLDNEANLSKTNIVVYLMACMVQAQIQLLYVLREKGMLNGVAPTAVPPPNSPNKETQQ